MRRSWAPSAVLLLSLFIALGAITPTGAAASTRGVISPSGIVIASSITDGSVECPQKVPLGRGIPTRVAVLKDVDALLARTESKKALARFRKSKAYSNVPAARKAASAALLVSKPGAALAAMSRAARLAPKDALLLHNTAVLLLNMGKPRDALGLIAAARMLPKPKSVPLGMKFSAVLDADEAGALLLGGKYARAEKLYRRAAAADRLLAEARTGVGVALTCRGKTALGARWLVRGERRVDAVVPGSGPLDPEPPDGIQIPIDLNKGKTATFPNFVAPLTVDQAVANRYAYKAAKEGAQAEFLALTAENLTRYTAGMNRVKLSGNKPIALALFQYRDWKLQNDKHLAALKLAAGQARIATQASFPPVDEDGCPWTSRHANMWDKMNAEFVAIRAQALEEYRLTTAIAANLADPDLAEALNLQARALLAKEYSVAMGFPATVAEREADEVSCHGPGATPQDVPDKPERGQGVAACNALTQAVHFKVSIANTFELDANCSEVSLGASHALLGAKELAWIGPFATAQYTYGAREMTLTIGGKAQVGGGEDWIPGASATAGIYIKIGPSPYRDKDHPYTVSITDFGVVVGASAEVPTPTSGVVNVQGPKFDTTTQVSLNFNPYARFGG